ncbi:MAG: hypothetical protein IPK26_26915 [Planctomycetes bacterium]|nr:hypothetical protein [Planctomycetota bacterium]
MSIRSLPKSALAALAACGISVASTPTSTEALTQPTLTQRIDAVRNKLAALETAAVVQQDQDARQTLDLAWNNCWQNCWNNWQNWNNWHNCWNNWNNWQNWSNCWRNW